MRMDSLSGNPGPSFQSHNPDHCDGHPFVKPHPVPNPAEHISFIFTPIPPFACASYPDRNVTVVPKGCLPRSRPINSPICV